MVYGRFPRMALFALSGIIFLTPGILNPKAFALPTGGQSVSGNVQFQQSGQTMTVSSQAQRSIAEYQSFNIGHGETVQFNLPARTSAILNRVVGQNPSEIMGAMRSNGHVFLVNPSGVLFGPSAQVNVGALTVSTMQISNQDFLNGNLKFNTPGPGSIVNEGLIETETGGSIAMLGSAVVNRGTLNAPMGSVHLAVGDQITMTTPDGMHVQVEVDAPLQAKIEGLQEAILNTGTIRADGGVVKLHAELAKDLYSRAINNEGLIEAVGVNEHDGVIELVAHAENTPGGLVRNAGTINANGSDTHPDGGTIAIEGDYISQRGTLQAEGENGGAISMLANQQINLVDGSFTSVKASTRVGNGGNVKILSSLDTYFRKGALIDASAGADGGDGGSISVSGLRYMSFDGRATAAAPNGKGGSLVLDPTTLNLVAAAANAAVPNNADGNPDITIGDAPDPMNLDVRAGGSFTGFSEIYLQASDINVNGTFNLDTATGGTLTSLILEANNNLNINAPLESGNLGSISVQLLANNDHGFAGTFTIDASGANTGRIDLTQPGGTLLIRGGDFVLNGAGATINAPNTAVTISPYTFGDTMALNIGGAGGFNISTTELSQITAASSLTFGDANIPYAGNISVNTALNEATHLPFATTTFHTDGTFANTAGSTIEGNNVTINADDGITLNADLSSASNGTLSLDSGGGDVTLNANINAGTGDVEITNSTNIIRTAGTITADDLTLRSSGDIGSVGNAINTQVSRLSASTVGGDIYVSQNGALSLFSNNNASGVYNLTTNGATADITILNQVSGANVLLNAGRSILDGNNNASGAASPDILSTGDMTLTAVGVVGNSSNPLDISVTGGLATISAEGTGASDRSIDIFGTVSPTNRLTLGNSPPGQGFYNGVCFYNCPASSSTTSTETPVTSSELMPTLGYLYTNTNNSSNPGWNQNMTTDTNTTPSNPGQNPSDAEILDHLSNNPSI